MIFNHEPNKNMSIENMNLNISLQEKEITLIYSSYKQENNNFISKSNDNNYQMEIGKNLCYKGQIILLEEGENHNNLEKQLDVPSTYNSNDFKKLDVDQFLC
jgi:hypothetical protein